MTRTFEHSGHLLAGLLVLLGCTRAHAQPQVRVRAASHLELSARAAGGDVVVSGRLSDELGVPLPLRPVRLSVTTTRAQLERLVHTDEGGRFEARFEAEGGTRPTIRARFASERLYDASEARRVVDLDRAEVELSFEDGAAERVSVLELDLDEPSHVLSVRARSAAGGEGLAVVIENELGSPVARGVTDATGNFRTEVPSSVLGPPSAGALIARTPGDERRGEAETRARVVRSRASRLTLRLQPSEVTTDEPVTLEGVLRDARRPLEGRAVGLYVDGDHRATVITDGRGRYRHELRTRAAGDEPLAHTVQARFHSGTPWHRSAASPARQLRVLPPTTPASAWLLVPVLACAAIAWWRLRPRAEHAGAGQGHETIEAGVRTAPVRRRSRHDQRRVKGRVIDLARDVPLAGCRVELRHEEGEATVGLHSDPHGSFESPPLATGGWTLDVSHDGYMPARSRFTIPHRGEWSQLHIRLEDVRTRALRGYREVAMAVLPSRRLWSLWTPRETLEGAHAPPPALEPLTDWVERACYGAEAPGDEEIARIDRAAQDALQQLRSGPAR